MALTHDAAYILRVQQLKAAGRTTDPGVLRQLYASGDSLAVSAGTTVPPVFTTHPTSASKALGQSVTFTIVATGAVSYQWQCSADNLTWAAVNGATSASYTISSVAAIDIDKYYRCVATNPFGSTNSNSAVLTLQPTYLVDELPSPTFAVGTIRLKTGYAGTVVKVRRSSDNAVANIALNGDVMNATTFATHIGVGSGYATELVDQNGSAFVFANATTGQQPQVEADANGVYGPHFGKGSVLSKLLSTIQSIPQPFTIYFLNVGDNSLNGRVIDAQAAESAPTVIKSGDGVWAIYGSGGLGVEQPGGQIGAEKFCLVANGASSYFRVGAKTVGPFSFGTGGYTGGMLMGCAVNTTAAYEGHILAAALYPAAHTSPQIQTAFDALDYPVELGPLIIADGDSQSYGTGLGLPGQIHVNKLQAKLALQGYTATVFNDGNPGETLATCMTTYRNQVISRLVSTRKCIVSFRGGTNDLSVAATGAQIAANWATYGTDVLGTGSAMILNTIIARGGGAAHTVPQNAERLAANVIARAASTYTYLTDVALLTQYATVAAAEADTGTWYVDKVHYSDGGNELSSDLELPSIIAYLES